VNKVNNLRINILDTLKECILEDVYSPGAVRIIC